MKALRYLLSMVAVLSVLSLCAQTPKYGTMYNPTKERAAYGLQVNTQMPEATISSTSSDFMSSGSTLPQAAVTGTTTTFSTGRPGNIRRAADGDDDDTPPSDPHGPMEDPIGDVMWPLALLALAYTVLRVYKRKRV